jgi:uncharacterized RDD family membrane protein YckC
MECKVCGQDNPAGASFCGNCGATLVAVEETPTLAQTEAAPVVAGAYAGFWIRFGAAVIDAVAVGVASFTLSLLFWGGFGGLLLGLLYYWLFTGLRGQTPGKMAVGIKVVNAQGDVPGLGSAALREIPGKLISAIAFCVGFLWIAFDENKQGWHDKIANTHVVRVASTRQEERDDAVP